MNIPLNIDWQQILLHLFNFFILFGGLYILLYKPVKDFMAKREAYYAEMDSLAKKNLSDAENKKAEYDEKLNAAKKEIDEMKSIAAKEAEEISKERLKTVEDEKRKIIEEAKTAAKAQRDKILFEANTQIEAMVSEAIDKAMSSTSEDSFDEFLKKV